MKELSEMTEQEIREQAAENAHVFLVRALAETLLYAKKNYYNGYTTVSDEEYDILEQGLLKLCPTHPVLQAVGDSGFECLLGVVETRKLVKALNGPMVTLPVINLNEPPKTFIVKGNENVTVQGNGASNFI